MTYEYHKQCKGCSTVFYRKEISEEQFRILEENPNIRCEYSLDQQLVDIATIMSHCPVCAEKHYKEEACS